MKFIKYSCVALTFATATLSFAADKAPAPAKQPPLADELKNVQISSANVATTPTTGETLYAVQDRLYPLKYGVLMAGGVGRNFNTNGLVSSNETFGNLRFYFNDRIFTSFYGSQVNNRLSGAGERLKDDEDVFPDVTYIRRRADAQIGANLFYGKFRLTMDQTFYFDHYISLGAGMVDQTNGEEDLRSRGAVGETGFAFWFGRVNFNVGAKDFYFEEQRRLSSGRVHHVIGFSSIGVLLGGQRNA